MMSRRAAQAFATACAFSTAIGFADTSRAQSYQVGQTVEATYGGPWMVCTVVKHNEKQTDYEVSCPGRPDTFRAADDADHIRPYAGAVMPGAQLPTARTVAPAPMRPAAGAPGETYHVGQIVEATYGGPWLVCTVVKHNVKQEDYEVSCPDRPDTFRAADDANHIRPHAGGFPPAKTKSAPPAAARPAQQAINTALPPMGPAPASSASNVLLGRWKLTEGPCDSLVLEYLPHQSRDYNKASAGLAPYWAQRNIESYVREGTKVFLMENAGHVVVNIRDNNHIVPDGRYDCVYTRM